MSDFGFTFETTPGEKVREFYRRQGEVRCLAYVLEKLEQLEEMRLIHGLDLGFEDAQEVIVALADVRVAQALGKGKK